MDFDLDFEVAFFSNQMKLKRQTVAEIINLSVLNIYNSIRVQGCEVRRNSSINVESLLVEFDNGLKVDIQFHIHKQYLKEQLSAPEVIKKGSKIYL